MRHPIIILAMPRSGSSMTAGIFAHHGVWVGPYRKGDRYNAKGYYESTPFKQLLIAHCGRLTSDGEVAQPVKGWRQIAEQCLKDNGYTGGPWLVKHSALYAPLWREFEDAKYVCVRRDVGAVIDSGKRSRMGIDHYSAGAHAQVMDNVVSELGGVNVYTDNIVNGDYSSLRKAFDYCGLEFAAKIADSFIDPSLFTKAES